MPLRRFFGLYTDSSSSTHEPPSPEAEIPQSSSSLTPTYHGGPYSPVSDLIIEKEPEKPNPHDHPDSFYDELLILMIEYAKKLNENVLIEEQSYGPEIEHYSESENQENRTHEEDHGSIETNDTEVLLSKSSKSLEEEKLEHLNNNSVESVGHSKHKDLESDASVEVIDHGNVVVAHGNTSKRASAEVMEDVESAIEKYSSKYLSSREEEPEDALVYISIESEQHSESENHENITHEEEHDSNENNNIENPSSRSSKSIEEDKLEHLENNSVESVCHSENNNMESEARDDVNDHSNTSVVDVTEVFLPRFLSIIDEKPEDALDITSIESEYHLEIENQENITQEGDHDSTETNNAESSSSKSSKPIEEDELEQHENNFVEIVRQSNNKDMESEVSDDVDDHKNTGVVDLCNSTSNDVSIKVIEDIGNAFIGPENKKTDDEEQDSTKVDNGRCSNTLKPSDKKKQSNTKRKLSNANSSKTVKRKKESDKIVVKDKVNDRSNVVDGHKNISDHDSMAVKNARDNYPIELDNFKECEDQEKIPDEQDHDSSIDATEKVNINMSVELMRTPRISFGAARHSHPSTSGCQNLKNSSNDSVPTPVCENIIQSESGSHVNLDETVITLSSTDAEVSNHGVGISRKRRSQNSSSGNERVSEERPPLRKRRRHTPRTESIESATCTLLRNLRIICIGSTKYYKLCGCRHHICK